MRSFKKLKSNLDSGFTLIELLVVIIIIGILAGIAVIGVSGAQNAAVSKACTANSVQVAKGLRSYYAATGQFPKVAGDYSATAYTFSAADLAILKTSAKGKFLETVPPETDTTSTNTKFDLYASTDANDAITVKSVAHGALSTATAFCTAVTG